MVDLAQGKLLWQPEPAFARKTNIFAYQNWLRKRGHEFADYQSLWKWSVEDLEGFWGSVWKYFDVSGADYPVLGERKMPGAKWFDGADLNFAERAFARKQDGPALIVKSEGRPQRTLSWEELERKSASFAAYLRGAGVVPGDRVAAMLPNGPEAVIAFLGCASMGAVWSCCSPDFGAPSVVDRFGQIEPKVIVGTDGYSYGGNWNDRVEAFEKTVASLPTVERVVLVDGREAGAGPKGAVSWEDITRGKSSPEYEPLPFDHPLWILYSSGTTGLPKPIVHGHGGIVVELLKVLSLHNDIRPGDRFFWFTTTGWMMWNYLVGGLMHGATLVLYAGSPSYPGPDALWSLAEKTETTFLGGSAAYFTSSMRAGLKPVEGLALRRLRGIGSTGSPLTPETFEWVYSAVKQDVWLASVSGGTDVCTAFVGGCPTLPVHSGEIQCRSLGAKVQAFDENGNPVIDRVGELVLTEPMPSMPLYLWGDSDGSRYLDSYFRVYPGVWRHGDWVEITKRGSCIIYGRSDATIKRMGVRIGTSEIYRSVEGVQGVADSLAVDLEVPGQGARLVLFVVLSPGKELGEALKTKIREKMRADLSPRYVPDEILVAPSVPRTLNGKKLEVPIKRILMGIDPAKALNRESVADAASLDYYLSMAKAWKP